MTYDDKKKTYIFFLGGFQINFRNVFQFSLRQTFQFSAILAWATNDG